MTATVTPLAQLILEHSCPGYRGRIAGHPGHRPAEYLRGTIMSPCLGSIVGLDDALMVQWLVNSYLLRPTTNFYYSSQFLSLSNRRCPFFAYRRFPRWDTFFAR